MNRVYLIFLLKLILFAFLPIGADEAYYWVWSKHLQLGYFDHPPMIAWLMSLGTDANYILTRLPVIIFSILSLLVIFKIATRLNIPDKRSLLICVMISPLIGIGSFIATPDIAVMLFYLLSFYYFIKILDTPNWQNYLLFGASLGLGFLGKYHIVIFPLSAVIYLSFTRQWSKIKLNLVPVTIFAGLIFCFPVLLWNYQNDWASFTFQIKHGLAKGSWKFHWTWSYVLGQIIILSPLLIYPFIKSKNQILKYFTIVPLIFFFMTSFKGLVEANWPIIAYPFFYLAVYSSDDFRKLKKWSQLIWLSVYGVIVIVGLIKFELLPEKLKEPFVLLEAAERTQNYEPLYGGSYQIASSLWYFSKRPVYKLYDISRFDFFDTLRESKPQSTMFYLFAHDETNVPAWVLEEGYQQRVLEQFGQYKVYQFMK